MALLLIEDEYLLLDMLDIVLMELLRLSPLFSFANRLFILSSWSMRVSKLSVTYGTASDEHTMKLGD